MSKNFKVEISGFPHMFFYGHDHPVEFWQEALDDPKFGEHGIWKHPSIKTFGFNRQEAFSSAIPTNGRVDGSFQVSEGHFDLASLSAIRFASDLTGGSEQIQWVFNRVRAGGFVAVELSPAQAKHFAQYFSKRLAKYSIVRQGSGTTERYVIFGEKQRYNAKGSRAKEKATARIVDHMPCLHDNFAKAWADFDESTKIKLRNQALHTETYPCFAPESFLVSGHADPCAMPKKWRSDVLKEAFLKTSNFCHPTDLSNDISSEDGFGRPPMSPSVLSVTKYLASGRFADKSVCPETGMEFYARGYLKKKVFNDSEEVDGQKVDIKTEMNQTEGWVFILKEGKQNNYRKGQFYFATFA